MRPKVGDTGRLQRFLQRMGRRRVLAGRHREGATELREVFRAELFLLERPPQQARHQVG